MNLKNKILNLFKKKEKNLPTQLDKDVELRNSLHEVIEKGTYVLYFLDEKNNVLINCNIQPGDSEKFSRMMYEINTGQYEDSFLQLCPDNAVLTSYVDYINMEEEPLVQPYQAFQGKR